MTTRKPSSHIRLRLGPAVINLYLLFQGEFDYTTDCSTLLHNFIGMGSPEPPHAYLLDIEGFRPCAIRQVHAEKCFRRKTGICRRLGGAPDVIDNPENADNN
jgi:hypothetical protein